VSRELGQATFIVGFIAMMIIRAPYGRRSRTIPVAESRKGTRETALLAFTTIVIVILPVGSIVTPFLEFADYSLHPAAFWLGVLCELAGLWLFFRSHADLGSNWSMTLELRGEHTLVTDGVYRRIRHPMYAAMFLLFVAQALLLPNWLAGPVSAALTLLATLAIRLGPEEQMMLARFGEEYARYQQRTKRIVPGVW
jgi:protein-S-isoprenylcysteine O-methyltransferase Ste14